MQSIAEWQTLHRFVLIYLTGIRAPGKVALHFYYSAAPIDRFLDCSSPRGKRSSLIFVGFFSQTFSRGGLGCAEHLCYTGRVLCSRGNGACTHMYIFSASVPLHDSESCPSILPLIYLMFFRGVSIPEDISSLCYIHLKTLECIRHVFQITCPLEEEERKQINF